MGYLHIDNLYKNQTILLFKECYAMEKIHGTSAYIIWNCKEQELIFFPGGENHEKFVSLFDTEFLFTRLSEKFATSNAIIYGEAYGGKQQGMRHTYGNELKFIAFDVQVEKLWLNVPNAEEVCKSLNIEFVDYVKVSTDLTALDAERDKYSVQAIRNGCGEGKMREGVVLKPLLEFTTNNGGRVIAKHKRDEFNETKTPRAVNPGNLKILEDARAIAEEWVTEMRLKHVLDKLPQGINVESIKLVIDAMVKDVYREANGEIVESREVIKYIGSKTAVMFKKKLQNELASNH
ncbi:MAG: RNA ligase family protein [Bacteroidota bacterium]